MELFISNMITISLFNGKILIVLDFVFIYDMSKAWPIYTEQQRAKDGALGNTTGQMGR